MGERATRAEAPSLPEDYDRAWLDEGAAAVHLTTVDRRHLERIREAFHAAHPGSRTPAPEPRIPLVLHQIWLGDRPLPDRFRRFRQGWMEAHPDWEHRLWTDDEVRELDFGTRDLFEEADNHGMRSDILRAEILRRFGGLYADVDYECLRPFDRFHHLWDFYAGLRLGLGAHLVLPGIFSSPMAVCCSLYAATPAHPILTDYLRKVRRLWRRRDDIRLGTVERLGAGSRRDRLLRGKRTMKLTYLPFDSTVRRHLDAPVADRPMVLPPSYFNPVDTWWGWRRFLSPLYWKGRWKGGGRHYLEVQPHSFALHHSEASWV